MSRLKSWPPFERRWWQKKRYWLSLLAMPFLLLLVFLYQREISYLAEQELTAWEHAPQADCAVALTGGPGRLKEGLDLLLRGQVKHLIIAGVHPKSQLRDIFPQIFLFPQMDPKKVILERRSETTFGNAQQSLPIVEALNCRDIILVTSRLHMYRAYKVFRSSYPQEVGIVRYAVMGSGWIYGWLELISEASKSLFYSYWAY